MGSALVRQPASMAWELRAAWAVGTRIALSLDERCRSPRMEGHIQSVSPTGAFVVMASTHVPVEAILAVHRPSRLGDSDHAQGKAWRGRRRLVAPQSEVLL